MKKIIVLATLAFALGTVHQAVACDFGASLPLSLRRLRL
jgi:hypothetical protein